MFVNTVVEMDDNGASQCRDTTSPDADDADAYLYILYCITKLIHGIQ